MKKQLFLMGLFFVVAIFFNGCKKDNNTSVSTSLEGRWDLKSFVNEHYFEGKLQEPSGTHYSTTAYMVFEGKNVKSYDLKDELTNIGTYTLIGNKLSFTSHDMTTSVNIKWINADEFSVTNRIDLSIPQNEYYINTFVYTRHK